MNTLKEITMRMVVLCAAAVLTCGHAAATTVTCNFDETGWVNTAGTSENFFGSFIGTPEANGVLALSDLTGFAATLTETNAQGDTKPIATFGGAVGISGLTQFLFDPTANTLTLAATGSPGALVCLGDTIAAGACGSVAPRPVGKNGVPAPPLDGLFVSSVNGTLSAATTELPSVMLAPSSGGVASTPEPASSVLCGGALVLVSLVLRCCRARAQESSTTVGSRRDESV